MQTTPTQGIRRWVAPADIVDIFVYVVVLNLTVQFVPMVISESFTVSLLTALLLKAVLEVVVALKNRVKARFKAATTTLAKGGTALLLWLLLVGSKFVVLELVALLFGDRVSLGGFFSVTGLIIVLMLARFGVRTLLAEPVEKQKTDSGDETAPIR
jgi:hypothetical protein